MSETKTMAQTAKINSQTLFTKEEAALLTHKKCSRCRKKKEISEFTKDLKHSSGVKSHCKKCVSGDFKTWRDKNLEKQRLKDRVYHYVRKYGLDEEKAKELAQNRSGTCEICNKATLLVVDHCHKNGHIRGFICSPCNSTLGYARDNIDILLNCVKYLEKDGDGNNDDKLP